MDFLRIIRSLEEFLYEAMTWVIFYPRTLLRVALHPIRTLSYSQTELRDAPDEQYIDTVSPPLFLMLTLVIVHGIELAGNVALPVGEDTLMSRIFRSEQNLLIVRSLLFAVFPLIPAAEQLKLSGQPLNRKTLRAPFFGQCFPASVFSLLAGSAALLLRTGQDGLSAAGLLLAAFAFAWYLTVEIAWFRISLPDKRRAVLGALSAFAKALLIVGIAAYGLSTIS